MVRIDLNVCKRKWGGRKGRFITPISQRRKLGSEVVFLSLSQREVVGTGFEVGFLHLQSFYFQCYTYYLPSCFTRNNIFTWICRSQVCYIMNGKNQHTNTNTFPWRKQKAVWRLTGRRRQSSPGFQNHRRKSVQWGHGTLETQQAEGFIQPPLHFVKRMLMKAEFSLRMKIMSCILRGLPLWVFRKGNFLDTTGAVSAHLWEITVLCDVVHTRVLAGMPAVCSWPAPFLGSFANAGCEYWMCVVTAGILVTTGGTKQLDTLFNIPNSVHLSLKWELLFVCLFVFPLTQTRWLRPDFPCFSLVITTTNSGSKARRNHSRTGKGGKKNMNKFGKENGGSSKNKSNW